MHQIEEELSQSFKNLAFYYNNNDWLLTGDTHMSSLWLIISLTRVKEKEKEKEKKNVTYSQCSKKKSLITICDM